MVGEFPELQGVMGGHYARAQGEPAEIADAIRDHYKPVGQNDEVPTAPVTVAVALADKLDTLGQIRFGELMTTAYRIARPLCACVAQQSPLSKLSRAK